MAVKILIVDDEVKLQSAIQQLFRRQIRRKEFDFIFAHNGLQALERLQADAEIDLVLTDINMPQMDGLTFLAKLKELELSLNPGLTIIVISAYGDMKNIRQAMNLGAFDFLMKPLDVQDLKRTVQKTMAHNQRLKKAYEEKRLAEEALRRANEKLEQRVKERTAELEEANAFLKASNAELDAFAHMVAHDLKNPITSIGMFRFTIEENWERMEPEQIKKMVGLIGHSAQKANQIIDALLLLSGVRQKQVTVERLDMAMIMTQVQKRLAPIIAESQATLTMPNQWPLTYGYTPWIEQVWLNYLSNGLKYGGQPPQLELGASQIEGAVRFWVRDNGAGMTPQAQAALFREFTRFAKSNVEGFGLGLSIVKRIVEKLGGEVGVKSNLGEGSEFYFTLPSEL